ncbi:hypothetical protein TNIN_77131 [Trichonephila inaurata madagascariensis]|uniref:Uncharacterized protein n=1 Tax=Trichonephila inaurata madagascariensis TaxID=2747483 RepID=A0A8X6Y9Y0_9ARAC|nr:hypothetical protein TNIN_77131 [Trichonephila inaurata madagascariensis]
MQRCYPDSLSGLMHSLAQGRTRRRSILGSLSQSLVQARLFSEFAYAWRFLGPAGRGLMSNVNFATSKLDTLANRNMTRIRNNRVR